jgi:hypothetical protein
MKTLFYCFSGVILISLLTTCKEESTHEDCKTFVIEESIKDKTFNWPNSIRINECIRLETNEESILGNAWKVIIEDRKIFIFDRKDVSLKVFSEQGDFLFKIGNLGPGPGEYTELRDFCLGMEQNEVFILDYRKILCYNINSGKFIREIKLDSEINPMRFYWSNAGLFYLWTGNEKKGRHTLLLFDEKKIVKAFLPYKNRIMENERFTKNGDLCLLTPPDGDFHIYEIAKDEFYAKYYIDFGKLALPKSTIITRENAQEIDNSSYFNRITGVWETDQWLYLLAKRNLEYHEVLINKETKKILSGTFNLLMNPLSVIYTKDNEFYALVEPSQILESSKESILHTLLDLKLDELDNPVIIKFSL